MNVLIKEPEYTGKNRKGFLSLVSFLIFGGLLALGIFVSPELAFGGGVIKGMAAALPGEVIPGETPSTDAVAATSPNLLRDAVLKKIVQTHPSSFPLDSRHLTSRGQYKYPSRYTCHLLSCDEPSPPL
jgi:hypothetical protein